VFVVLIGPQLIRGCEVGEFAIGTPSFNPQSTNLIKQFIGKRAIRSREASKFHIYSPDPRACG
jgi:hypothetical protein